MKQAHNSNPLWLYCAILKERSLWEQEGRGKRQRHRRNYERWWKAQSDWGRHLAGFYDVWKKTTGHPVPPSSIPLICKAYFFRRRSWRTCRGGAPVEAKERRACGVKGMIRKGQNELKKICRKQAWAVRGKGKVKVWASHCFRGWRGVWNLSYGAKE